MTGEIFKWLSDALGYGAIGVGLAVAVLATMLLMSEQSSPAQSSPARLSAISKFMIFAGILVIIGAVIEVYKLRENSAQVERAWYSAQNLPGELWDDFVIERQRKLLGTAEPANETARGTLSPGETKEMIINIPKNECRKYFAVTRPPSQISAKPDNNASKHEVHYDREYYRTGLVCASDTEGETRVVLQITLSGVRSQYEVKTFVAEPTPVTTAAAPTPSPPAGAAGPARSPSAGPAPPPSRRLVICTGEYSANCAGSYDKFYPCGSGSDQELAALVCSPSNASARRLHTKGGNRCGYSLIEATCT